ncbi:MAG: hypothetical protein JXR10_13270 [Cyclobacteriaceae bacterium]
MRSLLFVYILLVGFTSSAQFILLGENAPFEDVLDGDFDDVWGYWRANQQSPHWKTRIIGSKEPMGLHHGSMFCMSEIGIAESPVLDANPEYQSMSVGDIWNWSFGADLEYISDGTISLSLIFGKREVILAEKVTLKGSDKIIEHFSGNYVITKEDVNSGLPFVRATFKTSEGVKVYLHYVNIQVVDPKRKISHLMADNLDGVISLNWDANNGEISGEYFVYRSADSRKGFKKIGRTYQTSFQDKNAISGIRYDYVITLLSDEGKEQVVSRNRSVIFKDKLAPSPPAVLVARGRDTEIDITWETSQNKDVSHYAVYRRAEDAGVYEALAYKVKSQSYTDFTPHKGIENSYIVYTFDHSGNRSKASKSTQAKVKAIAGASFSDWIEPIPIHRQLSSDLWGATGVIPRDSENGIEDSEWSYWGGRPVQDKDGKFHMCVTRWPANATKGHWEWPQSTVAHVVSDKPAGPYLVKDDLAYEYADGLGHNPDVILLNDGSYLLYSLINWEATLFKSSSMNGPWKRLGIMEVDTTNTGEPMRLHYRFYRNLSGVQLANGQFLFVTKAGAIMKSIGADPLGPYRVLTSPIQGNKIIPKKYRNSNYEDPVIWKDEVQYHMIINAFLDHRAIYLRSPDGINWVFNPGTAYTPMSTVYKDGTQARWYKLERPHVLQDEFGRATHLSVAAIDVPKADDLARDNHSSKNIIIPLNRHKRVEILSQQPLTTRSKKIELLVHSEEGFNAQTDLDWGSLKFGAPSVVDFGGGAKLVKISKKAKDVILFFEGDKHGITDDDFVGKILGKSINGELVVGYAKLKP